MEKRRKIGRLFYDEIPEILQRPLLLHNYMEVISKIENLSSLGVSLLVDKDAGIQAGDIFHLKYPALSTRIRCVCVYSDESGDYRNIGAYFTDTDDQKIILNNINLQNGD